MTRSSPTPLAYATPGARWPRRRWFSVTAFVIAAVPIAAMYALVEWSIPRTEMLYKDFGLKLPTATQLVLGLARAGYHPNYLPALAVPLVLGFAVPAVMGNGPDVGDRPRRRRWLWTCTGIAVTVLLSLAAAVAVLVIPMTHLFAILSGGK